MSAAPKISESAASQEKPITYQEEHTHKNYDLPRMPPWFVYVGSLKLYQALSGILRLVGSSLMGGHISMEFLFILYKRNYFSCFPFLFTHTSNYTCVSC
ncbi:hypothetical protein CsatB_001562 [Cannabis sativa]